MGKKQSAHESKIQPKAPKSLDPAEVVSPEISLNLTPSNIVRLQRVIGNQAVQRLILKAVIQRTVKDKLNKAMDGLGTDEDAIYDAITKATLAEKQDILNDDALMARLRDELTESEMTHVEGLLGPKYDPDHFKFFYETNGLSMTDILTKMDGMDRGKLDAHMAEKATFAGFVDMPRFDFAYEVVTTKLMSAVGVPPAQKTEAEAFLFNDIKRICKTIPTGIEAIAIMDTYSVGYIYGAAGGGSFFASDSNKMTLDPTEDTTNAALTFVHEMNHAKYHHENLGADIMKLSKKKYVKGMVEEEAEGTVKSIEAKVELEGTTIDVSSATFPLEAEYRQAYQAAIDKMKKKKKKPPYTDEQLKAAGRVAGKKRVIKGFMKGEVQTSNTGESYPDYYGKAWKDAHPPRRRR